MITSFTDKLKSLIFSSTGDDGAVTYNRKRKRPLDEGDAWASHHEGDVEITTLKKPKLHEDSSVIKSFFSSAAVQSMSDWVQKKTPKLFNFSTEDTVQLQQPHSQMGAKSSAASYMDRNGDSHHRFKRVDHNQSENYMTGSWPQNGANDTKNFGRRPIHFAGSKSMDSSRAASETEGRGTRKKLTTFDRLFKTRNRHKFTAGESVRLDEKVRYQQLLQQFTTVPLEPVTPNQPETIKNPVCVPKLPRFFFSSNSSILGSQIPQEVIPRQQPDTVDRSKMIKVHPVHQSTPQATRNGHRDIGSPLHITDLSVITQDRLISQDSLISQERFTSHNRFARPALPSTDKTAIVDLTDDEPIQESKKQIVQRSKSPVDDYRNSKFLNNDWIKDLNKNYNAKARERQRKIAEEEMKVKLLAERATRPSPRSSSLMKGDFKNRSALYDQRRNQDLDLEKRIRHQMQIHAREPAVIEDPPIEDIVVVEEEEEEEKEEEFIELTPEMEKKISNSLRGGSGGEVLIDKFRLQITRGDIATLSGLNWLNDEVINFYMNLLMERGEKTGFPKVHAFNTFFYPKIMNGGQKSVRRWTKKVDVLAVDYILVPVHLGMHWCLAVVDFKKKDIQYYDSMGGNNMQCLNALKAYLRDESQDKKGVEFDLNGWKTTQVKDIPQQMNGSDCGMFACKYAEYITRRAPISFTQTHMPYFRRRMVYEIVTGQLLQ